MLSVDAALSQSCPTDTELLHRHYDSFTMPCNAYRWIDRVRVILCTLDEEHRIRLLRDGLEETQPK